MTGWALSSQDVGPLGCMYHTHPHTLRVVQEAWLGMEHLVSAPSIHGHSGDREARARLSRMRAVTGAMSNAATSACPGVAKDSVPTHHSPGEHAAHGTQLGTGLHPTS